MKKKSYAYSALFILLFLLTLLFFYWFTKSSHFANLQLWTTSNKPLYLLLLFLLKTLGIVWPPIPSGLFTMASIPLIGWKTAYAIDLFGSVTGGMIAYSLGKKYGIKFLEKIFDKKVLVKIKNTKIKKGKEFEAVFMYRILLGTTILEAVYYGAGLLKVNLYKFLLGAVASHLLIGIPSFIMAENIFNGKNILITLASILISVFIVYKTKDRYFE